MTIFVFMKKMNIKNKYVFSLVIISIMVAFLIHFPELVSLFDVTGQNALFPDMSVLDVANEVFFTFVSLLLLFAMNTYVFGFNRQKAASPAVQLRVYPVLGGGDLPDEADAPLI